MIKNKLMAAGLIAGLAAALSMVGAIPATRAQNRCKPLLDVFDTVETSCLSGRAVVGEAKIKGALSILKRAVEGEANLSGDLVKGAARDLDDALRVKENDSIRQCLAKIREALIDCALEEISGAGLPRQLAMQFRVDFKRPDDPVYWPDRVAFGAVRPPSHFPDRILLLQDSWYTKDIPMPAPEERFVGLLTRAVKQGHHDFEDSVELCLTPAARPPGGGPAYSRLLCAEGGDCRLSRTDPGWLALCERRNGGLWLPRLIGTAHAQPRKGQIWKVPSLASLEARRDLVGVGYTVFEITSDSFQGLAADAVSYALTANGTRILVEGLPPAYASLPFDNARPLRLRFALQNLDFAGVEAGCDRIGADIQFYDKGRPVGAPYRLSRTYVALRDAREERFERGDARFRWRGAYRRPHKTFDHEVFVQSILLRNWDDAGAFARARRTITRMKATVDKLHLTFGERPVVAVIRPPLTKPSFGLALGLVEPTGQIRFTFAYGEAKRLWRRMLDRRQEDAAVAGAIRHDSFIYTVNKDHPSPPDTCVG
ncbi:MAG: hypothetical protein QF578_11830 [Alphaproteobacteria bacterium]|nr:hypothetical protein [Alphaproteobacteria bacterium]MDP6565507.1 hypothetical protein [Alphaproteobacteria bacterium]MDP6816199.1 hypothetical protein [Alphaproteobacteria bacterium]